MRSLEHPLEIAQEEKNERATFYDVLLRKYEKCGAGMENSLRNGTFPSMIWKHSKDSARQVLKIL